MSSTFPSPLIIDIPDVASSPIFPVQRKSLIDDQESPDGKPSSVLGLKGLTRRKILLVRNNGSQDFVTTEGRDMLVLSRKLGEVLVIGNSITVTVVAVDGDRVRLGIVAPAEVPVHREEVYQRIGNGSSSRCFAECT